MELSQIVKVYNSTLSNSSPIAIFSKDDQDDFLNDNKMISNKMIDPTVSLIQNGSSTFTFMIDSRCDKWQYIKDLTSIYEVNGRLYTPINENSYAYTRTERNEIYVTVTAVELWYTLSTKYVQAYNSTTGFETIKKDDEGNIISRTENIDEFMVVLVPGGDKPLKINGAVYNNNPYRKGSAGYVLWSLLQGTGWTLSVCDVTDGTFNFETDQQDVLTNIQKVQELWGGILVWDSMKKTLSLRDENKWQPNTGYEFRHGKNINGIDRIENNDIVTYLIPLGEAGLNIKSVNSNKLQLEDYSYSKEVRKRIINNQDFYIASQLKEWAQRKLKEMSLPKLTITIKAMDLRTISDFEHETFDLNDVVAIIDEDLAGNAREYLRIIEWEYKVFASYDANITLGDRTKNVVDILYQSQETSDKVDNTIDDMNKIPSNNVYDRNSGCDIGTALENEVIDREIHIKLVQGALSNQIDITAGEIRVQMKDTEKELSTLISVKAGEIYTQIDDNQNKMQSSISQKADSIILTVTNMRNGVQSTITQTANNIMLRVSNEAAGLSSYIDVRTNSIISSVNDMERGLSSSIIQTERSIVSTVNDMERGLSSEIRQTASSIDIVARDVNIISNNFSVINGNLSAISGKFSNLSTGIANIQKAIITRAEIQRLINEYFSLGAGTMKSLTITGSLTVQGGIMGYSHSYFSSAKIDTLVAMEVNGYPMKVKRIDVPGTGAFNFWIT